MVSNTPWAPHGRARQCSRLIWVLCAAWSVAGAVHAADRHVLWEVRGAHHSLWLLGSIHMLTAAQAELPPVAMDALQRSSRLLMELDPLSIGPQSAGPETRSLTHLLPGQTLQSLIGARRQARLQHYAQTLGIDPAYLAEVQPWFAATTLDAVYLTRLGFDPNLGVDVQMARRARADGKPILELESVAEQYGFFARLPFTEQNRYLDTTLRELPESRREALAAVRAWQAGDLRALESELRHSQRDSPALRDILIGARNRRWLPRIETLLDDDEGDCLVVVGALHLVGQEGLVSLLRAHGRRVEQR